MNSNVARQAIENMEYLHRGFVILWNLMISVLKKSVNLNLLQDWFSVLILNSGPHDTNQRLYH